MLARVGCRRSTRSLTLCASNVRSTRAPNDSRKQRTPNCCISRARLLSLSHRFHCLCREAGAEAWILRQEARCRWRRHRLRLKAHAAVAEYTQCRRDAVVRVRYAAACMRATLPPLDADELDTRRERTILCTEFRSVFPVRRQLLSR